MRSRRLIGIPLLVTAWGVCTLAHAATAGAQELARGEVLADVKCASDVAQSYALYLPSNYSADRKWPLLMGFHPSARGIAITEKYRAAAEKYGYIVAASNNSRNGPWSVSERAINAMTRDLAARFSIDDKRLYATGHSGGARVAMQLALNNPFAGVIASSAGLPDAPSQARIKFAVFGTAGDTDFNYIEMRLLDNSLRTPHRLVIFAGGHALPPDDVAMEAVEWLELQAMKSGIRQKDEAMLESIFQARTSAATARGVDPVRSTELLRAVIEDFRGLRDVKVQEATLAYLYRDPNTRRAIDRRRAVDRAEIQTLDDVRTYERGLRDDERRSESMFSLRQLLQSLQKKATAATDSLERDSARRLLRILTMNAAERTSDKEYLALLEKYRSAR